MSLPFDPSRAGAVRPVQGFYLRRSATFDRVGPLCAARTLILPTLILRDSMQRGGTGKPLLIVRVDVLEGPSAGATGFAVLSLDDLAAAYPDRAEAVAAVEARRSEFRSVVAEHLTRDVQTPDAHPPAAEEDGLVIDGHIVPLPGLEVLSYLRHPKLVPEVTDGRARTQDVRSVVIHTVHGKQGDVLEAASAPSTRAERYAKYQTRTARDVSWHMTLDTDGTLLVSGDLRRRLCWHAPPTNGWSIGLELVQEDNGRLYGPQLDVAVKVITRVCDLLRIPCRVPVDAAGRPYRKPVKAWQPRVEGGASEAWAGVLGHRNLTVNRGIGDPGDGIMHRLLAAGFEPFVIRP